MKIHKISLYIADLNDYCTLEDVKTEIENGLSDDFIIWLGNCESKYVGEWSDDHRWNSTKIKPDKEWQKI